MTNAIMPVLRKVQEPSPMPAKSRYDKARKTVRLDEASLAALEKLMEKHGKDESKLIREALIEKAQRDVPAKITIASQKG